MVMKTTSSLRFLALFACFFTSAAAASAQTV